MITLCGPGIGTEEIQRGTVRKDNRVAFQVNIDFAGNLNDVLLEYMCLCLTSGKKYLIAAGQQRVHKGFAGKIICRPYLAGFEDIADAVLRPGAVPVFLILKHVTHENLFQLFDLFVAEHIFFRGLTFTGVTVHQFRVEIGLISAVLIAPDFGGTLQLTA